MIIHRQAFVIVKSSLLCVLMEKLIAFSKQLNPDSFSSFDILSCSCFYRAGDEQKLLHIPKVLWKINAGSAVSRRWSKGCSADEASDHCKITAREISGLKKRSGG